jgi:F0F1-type ATP synthase epsilon subunit
MADGPFLLELVTPSGVEVSRQAVYVEVPGEDGRLGVLAGHQTGIIGLSAGQVTARFSGTNGLTWTTGPGVMTITPAAVSIIVQSVK